MPDQEFEYDVFLSHTEANKAEAQNLYECLRMEFFLARKTYDEMGATTSTSSALNTCRFDRKIIYFFTSLDATDGIRPALQQILRNAYVANVSKNALQVQETIQSVRFMNLSTLLN